MKLRLMSKYIFTVTAGRSGQSTLANLMERYVENSYVAFEEPQIKYIFKGKFVEFERIFRRKFIETHELLGRGKILTAFIESDLEYILKVVKKRVHHINSNMIKNQDQIYIDVSKYFARGLHLGFQKIVPKFSLIHLVRDPIVNVRSFLNRNKNFYLDNNSPAEKSNILVLDRNNIEKSDLYLWAWCEMALRYEKMKKLDCVDSCVVIKTEKLNDPVYVNNRLDLLGIPHHEVKNNRLRLNTNSDSGYNKTEVSKTDICKFEKFISKAPRDLIDSIPYLYNYDPYSIF